MFAKHVSQLPELLTLSDLVYIYDNSGNGYELLAQKQGRGEPLGESDILDDIGAAKSPYLQKIMDLSALSPAIG